MTPAELNTILDKLSALEQEVAIIKDGLNRANGHIAHAQATLDKLSRSIAQITVTRGGVRQ